MKNKYPDDEGFNLIRPLDCAVIKNLHTMMGKENKDLTGTIDVLKHAVRHCNLLLIDDLFSTGATATECTRKLQEDPLIDEIYVSAISKTRT